MLENLEKTLTKAVNNFDNIEISKEKRDIQNKISVLFNSSELDNYFKQTFYLSDIENILLELKDLKNKVEKTFLNSHELSLRKYKSNFINQLLTVYLNKQKVLKDNQEFYIICSLLNSKRNEFPVFTYFLNFIIHLLENNIKSKIKEFNIEFYSLDNENIFFKLNKNISQLKKINSCYEVEKRDIKEIDTTLIYTDITKELFYKIFVQSLNINKYDNNNGIIINKENNLINMFNSREIFNNSINLSLDNDYIISRKQVNFDIFNNIYKLLKKDDIISLSIKKGILYIKLPDQTIKEIELRIFDLNQDIDNTELTSLDKQFLNYNKLIQENYDLNSLNHLISFQNIQELKELNNKLNVFDKSYKNDNDFTYNHSIKLNINKRILNLNINSIETFTYFVKDGTKQEEIRTYKTNKRGKHLSEYTSTYKTVDNIIQKENKKEITDNLLNVFSSKYNKDYSIDLNLYLDYFIKITGLMIKNNFLNISLSNDLNQFILHDKINYIISSYSIK